MTEDIKKRLKKIGSLGYIAKRLVYSYGYVKNISNGTSPPSEMFLIKLKKLEDQKDEFQKFQRVYGRSEEKGKGKGAGK